MTHHTSYLHQLTFDPRLTHTGHGKYLKSIRIVLLLILMVILVGIGSYVNLPKRLNPEIQIPIIIVNTILPGAGPADVESQITEHIEDALDGVEGVNTITSVSQDNISSISVEFSSASDKNRALSDVQAAVNGISTLPQEAKSPVVRAVDFEDQPVWTFAVSGEVDEPSLYQFARTLRDDIVDLPAVDRVVLQGEQTDEVQILLSMESVRALGLDAASLSRSVASALATFPAGTVSNNSFSFNLAIDPQVTTVDDIRAIIITANGHAVRLEEIATVRYMPKPESAKTYIGYSTQRDRVKPAVVVYVYKTKSSNIDQAAVAAEAVVDEAVQESHGRFTVSTLTNTGEDIATQFGDLTREFGTTIVLIFITLLLFLGIRQALVVSFTVPLTFLWTFAVMRAAGLTLNFLSLFSLLLSLGLLVDDAVVVVTAMTAYMRTGKFSPYEASLLVWRDFIVPIWTTTIATVWAFIPLLLSTGLIGEFIQTIPIVVSSSLLTSTAIAVLVTLPLTSIVLQTKTFPSRIRIFLRVLTTIILLVLVWRLIPDNPLAPVILLVFAAYLFLTHNNPSSVRTLVRQRIDLIVRPAYRRRIARWLSHGVINIPKLASVYERVIRRILLSKSARNLIIGSVIIFSLFSYLLLPLGYVVNEFFPKADTAFLYATLELPAGTTAQEANVQSVRLLPDLVHTPGVTFVTAETGRGAPTDMGSGQGGKNVILYTFILPTLKQQTISSQEIAASIRKRYPSVPMGTFSVIEISGGPPAGSDLQIKLLGEDLAQLDGYADRIIGFLSQQKGITNARKSITGGISKLTFVPDQTKMAKQGISVAVLGNTLRGFASGITADSIKVNGDDLDIVIRTDTDTHTVEDIGRIIVSTQQGGIPLSALGTFSLKPNPTQITRENGKRTIRVSAGVVRGFSVTAENTKLEAFARSLGLPAGYEWQTGGVNEENQKSVQSILQAMILSMVLIMATMVIQFNSYRKAVIVLLVIPLAISGVFLIFALTGTPLSFPSLIGILALFGIVVNNSMMIVDKITVNQKTGMKLIPSISDACASRMEPIILTKLLTIMGLLPITLSDPLWRGLGGAIISGILFSSSIMLFFIPTIYFLWYQDEKMIMIRPKNTLPIV